jgi:hypothetical protein
VGRPSADTGVGADGAVACGSAASRPTSDGVVARPASDAPEPQPASGTAVRLGAPNSDAGSAATPSDPVEGMGTAEAGEGDGAAAANGAGCGSAAMPWATLLSAAITSEGSWASAARLTDPTRAPAVAASEPPAVLVGSSGKAGELVSARHRSSHSVTAPPQPRTYAESTGRSGSAGPASAARIASRG